MATSEGKAAPAPRTTVDLPIPPSAEERNKPRQPIVTDLVWFFDQSRELGQGRVGLGPYAAIVTRIDLNGGVSLYVLGPDGGRFEAVNTRHKTEVWPDGQVKPGRARWWEWPSR